jgi:hypothetical protein
MSIEELCTNCGNKMVVVLESNDKDAICYRADCRYCHRGFSAVVYPSLPAPVIRLEAEDSSTQ